MTRRFSAPEALGRSLVLCRVLVWCLLVAVPCYGWSGAVTALLGASHVHRHVASAVADPMQGWVDFRRAGSVDVNSLPRPHTHSIFERHHHDVGDASVVSLDHSSDDGASAPDGAGSVVLALAAPIRVAPPSFTVVCWHSPRTEPVTSSDLQRIERPPRAA